MTSDKRQRNAKLPCADFMEVCENAKTGAAAAPF